MGNIRKDLIRNYSVNMCRRVGLALELKLQYIHAKFQLFPNILGRPTCDQILNSMIHWIYATIQSGLSALSDIAPEQYSTIMLIRLV